MTVIVNGYAWWLFSSDDGSLYLYTSKNVN